MFKSMIDQEYRVHWLLDSLPVAVRNDELGYVTRGYPVGFVNSAASTGESSSSKKKHQHYLFNHVRIVVRYSEEPSEFDGARIVGGIDDDHLGPGLLHGRNQFQRGRQGLHHFITT